MNSVLVWDLETVPDLPCVARVHGLAEGDEPAAREALGDKFPKLPFHKIVCVGALRAERTDTGWEVKYLGAPHAGDHSEAELIRRFAQRINETRPQLVTFNGGTFDMPVLRYRAMINRVPAPGLECRRYWYRYSEDCLDLCDALACFNPGAKLGLNDLCRALGVPGKAIHMDGSMVERFVQEGRLEEVATYCELDVIATYRVWLIYELFRGTLSPADFQRSEEHLLGFLGNQEITKPHLRFLLYHFSASASVPEGPTSSVQAVAADYCEISVFEHTGSS